MEPCSDCFSKRLRGPRPAGKSSSARAESNDTFRSNEVTQADSSNGTRSARRAGLKRYLFAAALVFAPQMLWAQSAGQFEQPPIVQASQLLPATALSGPGYHVEQLVPTNGAMGQYTIVADASVFQGDAGTYRVESLNLLKIRLSEMPAIAYLENVRKSGVFANALAQSAERPVTDA